MYGPLDAYCRGYSERGGSKSRDKCRRRYFAEMAEMRLCAMTIFSSAVLAIESEGISGGRSIERKYGVASR